MRSMVYEKAIFLEEFEKMAKAAGLEAFCNLPTEQRLYAIAKNLDAQGRLFNLTAITEPREVLTKHFIDSLFAAREAETLLEEDHSLGNALLDVGSGGGFPALPIAAALPQVQVTALDSTAKKIAYIRDTADLCGMQNVHTVCTRAEEAGRGALREQFSVVTARAVARLPVLLELCVPFVRVGGYFIAMKGSAAMEEETEAREAAALLSCALCKITPYSLPASEEKRFLLIYRKISPTSPTYPRSAARIAKKPLLPSFPRSSGEKVPAGNKNKF